MPDQKPTQPAPAQVTLARAINLAKSGQKSEAVAMLRKVVAAEPLNQAAWIWLSAVAAGRGEAEAALAQAKKINPNHPSLHRAEQWLVHRFSQEPPTRQNSPGRPARVPPVPPPRPASERSWLSLLNAFAFGVAILAVVVALIVLFFGLIVEISDAAQASTEPQNLSAELHRQLDSAWANRDWDQAISILEQLRPLEAEPDALNQRLAQAYQNKGQALRSRGFVAEANAYFNRALQFDPAQPQAQQEAALSAAYLRGAEYYQAGQWPQAIAELEQVWATDKSYINVKDLLYSAYYNLALAQQAAGEFTLAKQSLEAAILLHPNLSDPHRLLAELEFAMAPGTPVKLPHSGSIADRLILVGLAEQRMHVYDGDELVFDFVVSTGEPGRETAVGEFEILDKIDVAYASTWNLDMPYWMGIYWAGPLENGIHALPIVKHTGYKLWDGYLGQRVSYGCIILSDEDAAKLYEWTEVGTKVKIVPSLANWSPEGAF